MKHARSDYDQIQDPSGKIPEDEPVFLLRAQDQLAIPTLAKWISFAENAGASEAIIDAARTQLWRMQDWCDNHGTKVPDL